MLLFSKEGSGWSPLASPLPQGRSAILTTGMEHVSSHAPSPLSELQNKNRVPLALTVSNEERVNPAVTRLGAHWQG
jgi:hypothetical protein